MFRLHGHCYQRPIFRLRRSFQGWTPSIIIGVGMRILEPDIRACVFHSSKARRRLSNRMGRRWTQVLYSAKGKETVGGSLLRTYTHIMSYHTHCTAEQSVNFPYSHALKPEKSYDANTNPYKSHPHLPQLHSEFRLHRRRNLGNFEQFFFVKAGFKSCKNSYPKASASVSIDSFWSSLLEETLCF